MALVSVGENSNTFRIVQDDQDNKSSEEQKCNGIMCSYFPNSSLLGEHITVLKFTDLKLTELPEDLPELIHLYEINFSGNQLQMLPEKLIAAKSLRILNLSKNDFSSVPDCLIVGLRTLKHLNLSENRLTNFSLPPASLPLLRELILAHNEIELFPHWILYDYVYMLDLLDLSFNPCFKLGKHFQAPAKNRISGIVKILKLRNTNFTIVSLGLLLYFPYLISLDISNCNYDKYSLKNTITDLAVGYLPPTLEELYVQEIGLASAPHITSLKELKTLVLSANLFYWWPSDESLAPNLRHFELTGAMLVNVPDCIGKLAFLTHLLLSENEISSLPSSIHLLINLEFLDLYNNAMETMPELENLTKLRGLDMWMNYFEPPLRPLMDGGPSSEDLKNTLRKKFGFQRRLDIVKEIVEESTFTERSSSLCSTSPDVSIIFPEIQPLGNLNKSQEEEDWDIHGDDDDWFDPTLDQRYQKDIYPEIMNRDFGKNCLKYCPSDIQLSPHLFQPYAERTNSECWKQRHMLLEVDCKTVVDGQFDDA